MLFIAVAGNCSFVVAARAVDVLVIVEHGVVPKVTFSPGSRTALVRFFLLGGIFLAIGINFRFGD